MQGKGLVFLFWFKAKQSEIAKSVRGNMVSRIEKMELSYLEAVRKEWQMEGSRSLKKRSGEGLEMMEPAHADGTLSCMKE